MKKGKTRSRVLNLAAFVCFLLALTLVVLLRLSQMPRAVTWYNKYTDTLSNFEQWMQTHGATWYSVAMILLNFVLKAVVPWFPISCICVASGVLFKWYYAIAINVAGLTILFTIKYYWGRRYGGGNAEKILVRYNNAHQFIDSSQIGSSIHDDNLLLEIPAGVPGRVFLQTVFIYDHRTQCIQSDVSELYAAVRFSGAVLRHGDSGAQRRDRSLARMAVHPPAKKAERCAGNKSVISKEGDCYA